MLITTNFLLYMMIHIISYSCTSQKLAETVSTTSESSLADSLTNDKIFDYGYETSTSAGECVNNSVDNNCNYHQVLPDYNHDTDHKTRNANQLDDSNQLKTRLKEIDRLDYNQLFRYSNSSEWKAEGLESTLRQVIFIHRHGDRTPISFPSKDSLKNEPFWAFHGYGQLTNRGKARLFLLAKMIRRRYDKFLERSVNKNQRISRSSGALRCIESAQVFLSEFLGLNFPTSADAQKLIWDGKTNPLAYLWQPAGIQSVPASIDGMLAEGAECKSLSDEYLNVIDSLEEVKRIFVNYKNEAKVLNTVLGFEMDHFYKWFWSSSQIEVERSYFADKMKPQILAIYDRVQDAGNLALTAYQRTLKSKRLRSGLLINDMLINMKKFRDLHHQVVTDSPQLKKFIHYSAHDLTLIVLLGMLDSWDKFPNRPDYASNIAIELHEYDSEWFVRIFYMPQVPAKPIELHLARCEDSHPKRMCQLDMFEGLMRPYMIDSWQTWMRECENDPRKINPYELGN